MIVIMALFFGADEKIILCMLQMRCIAWLGYVMRPFQWWQPAKLSPTIHKFGDEFIHSGLSVGSIPITSGLTTLSLSKG
jgi:hypothetical protein